MKSTEIMCPLAVLALALSCGGRDVPSGSYILGLSVRDRATSSGLAEMNGEPIALEFSMVLNPDGSAALKGDGGAFTGKWSLVDTEIRMVFEALEVSGESSPRLISREAYDALAEANDAPLVFPRSWEIVGAWDGFDISVKSRLWGGIGVLTARRLR